MFKPSSNPPVYTAANPPSIEAATESWLRKLDAEETLERHQFRLCFATGLGLFLLAFGVILLAVRIFSQFNNLPRAPYQEACVIFMIASVLMLIVALTPTPEGRGERARQIFDQ